MLFRHDATSAALLYINDICHVVPGGKIKLFADDRNIFMTGKASLNLAEKRTWLL